MAVNKTYFNWGIKEVAFLDFVRLFWESSRLCGGLFRPLEKCSSALDWNGLWLFRMNSEMFQQWCMSSICVIMNEEAS